MPNAQGWLIRLARTGAGSAAYAALPFIGAWRLDWPRGWIYAALMVVVSVAGSLVVQLFNPGLLEARAKGLRQDTKPFDRRFYRLFLPLIVAYPLLAGLDAGRFVVALARLDHLAGVVLFIGSSIVGSWAMIVNPHAESTVRI